jgi:hypothetical protein
MKKIRTYHVRIEGGDLFGGWKDVLDAFRYASKELATGRWLYATLWCRTNGELRLVDILTEDDR